MALRALLISGSGGLACMVIELAAARLLAPWFGTSLVVWSNVLATVLAALALGYALGARWSRGADPARALRRALLGAAAAAAATPHLAPHVCAWLIPEGLTLAEAAPLLSIGSLAASLVLFGPAAALIACVQPLSSELVGRAAQGRTPDRRPGEPGAGDASGRVLAVSTLFGLAGIFLTVHVLVPRLGLRATFHAAAGVLLAAAVLARGLSVSATIGLIGLAVFAALAPRGRIGPALSASSVLLAYGESSLQSVRVIEDRSSAEEPAGWLRRLEVNEGFDSYQSVWKSAPGWLGEGFYYDGFALPPWWSGKTGTWRALVVGLGAGTALRVIGGALPEGLELESAGVEVDPLVVRFGREWMDLPAGEHLVGGLDGRAALRGLGGGWDEIVLDAYANQIEIPAHLATLEFFGEVRSALAPGGWAVANVGAFGLDDPVAWEIGRTLARAFEAPVLAISVPAARNVLLFARQGANPPEPGSAAFQGDLPEPAATLVARASLPRSWCWIAPGAEPWLTDDRAPLELLELASIARARQVRPGAAEPVWGTPSGKDPGAWDAALAQADYALALERTEGLDGVERLAARAEVFYAARDFEAVLMLATAALSASGPREGHDDLRFLARAAGAALWLRRGVAALDWLAELDAAIERSGLGQQALDLWRERAASDRASATRLAALDTAVARARVRGGTTAVSFGLILAASCALLLARGCSGSPCRTRR